MIQILDYHPFGRSGNLFDRPTLVKPRAIARPLPVIRACPARVSHAKKALEAIPGVAADVTLDPQRALVRMDRDVPESALRAAIEGEGCRVVSVSRR